MSTFTSRLDAAAGQTTCTVLQVGGQALVGAGAVALLTGNPVPIALGTAALLAANYGCDWDPNQPPSGGGIYSEGQCVRVSGGGGSPQTSNDGGQNWAGIAGFPSCAYIYFEEKLVRRIDDVQAIFSQSWETTGGVTQYQEVQGPIRKTRLFPCAGAVCGQTGDEPFPDVPPVIYTDPDTSCQINVTFQGFVSLPDGSVQPVYKMAPAGTARAGGVISGCNFEPVIYVGGPPGQPPYYGPWDPTWPDGPSGGTPPWLDFLNALVGGLIANATYDALKSYFDTKYPASSKEIYAACEFKEDGTPETFSINFPEETYQDRVLTALDAIVDFQQQFFLWKTPVCATAPIPITGEPVTINWISEQPLMTTGNYLRKLFTYFDQSGRPLADHVEHWRDFTWEAGPVVVSCAKTKLGKPQVWAASLTEAKRVIFHAADIAAVDLTEAEWLVGTPRSTRYGQPGIMRVHRAINGVLGITKRDGPSGLPEALP